MPIRFATEKEIANWNDLVVKNPDGGNILQSFEMAEQKMQSGWQPRYIVADSIAMVALEKTVLGLGKLWYVIKGPGVATASELEKILPGLQEFATEHGVFVIKIEPEIVKSDETLAKIAQLRLQKVRPIQPNASTIFLDISKDLDTVLKDLNQKGRHAIKRAERDGAVIKQVPATNENCRIMFDLYKITAEGQFPVRPYSYYKNFWQQFERAQMGQMFFAYSGDKVIAAAYCLLFGEKSTYKDGASLRDRPIYGMSHLLQWRMIEWAKSRGATIHDLCGAPPSDQIKNPDHPYYGFGRFKSSFSKEVVDFVGAYDIVIRPQQYMVWTNIGERLAMRLSYWRHRQSFY